MSSPGIRYQNLARVLSHALPEARVTLAVPRDEPLPEPDADYEVVHYEPAKSLPLFLGHDVVIAMSFPVVTLLASALLRRPLFVLDFFSQFYVEWMEAGRDLFQGLHRRLWTRAGQLYAGLQVEVADYILCANERQRDSYLGVLASLGRLTPATYDADPTLRRLIDVAPHGVRPRPRPAAPRRRVKGVEPGIGPEDRLLLWLGGILYWYDPVTLLRAMAELGRSHPEAKLLFLGSNYPGFGKLGQGRRYQEAVEEAKRLGLWETNVFFRPEWLPHEEVVDYLLEADVAVTTYFTNAETRFAHRTRFLDFIWAGVPIVCTEGDVLAEEVRERGWGTVVPEGDATALTAALVRLLEDEACASACRKNLAQAAGEVTWEVAFAPLVRFMDEDGGPRPIGGTRRQRWLPILRSLLLYGVARVAERSVEVAAAAFRRRFSASRPQA
jgi:glycosyltransferase involved in cell wall biosynthesis